MEFEQGSLGGEFWVVTGRREGGSKERRGSRAPKRVGPEPLGLKGPKISRFFPSPATFFFLSSVSWWSFRDGGV